MSFEETFCKEKSGASEIKSSAENITSMIYESLNMELFNLALYSCCGNEPFLTFTVTISLGLSMIIR